MHTAPGRPDNYPLMVRVLMVLRGLLAVLLLLGNAVASLASALLGIAPGTARRIGHTVADEYRAGRAGAIDAEVIDDQGDPA